MTKLRAILGVGLLMPVRVGTKSMTFALGTEECLNPTSNPRDPLLKRLQREFQAEETGRKIKIDLLSYYWLGLCTKSAEHFGKQD